MNQKYDRLDVIDSIRFIACLIVVLGHFNIPGFSYGWIGVDIFFVVSGYVVTRSLERRISKNKNSIDVAFQFVFDRFIRLYPALLFAITLGVVLTILFSTANDFSGQFKTGLSAIGGISNNTLHSNGLDYFALDAKSNFFTHTWSLGVEFQLYLAIAIITLFLSNWVSSSRNILLILTIIFFIIWAQNGFGWSYLTINRIWEFLFGILAYKFSRSNQLNLTIFYLFIVTISAVLLFNMNESISIFLIVVMTSIMLIFNANIKASKSYLKVFNRLATQGRATYSIYLVHWPIAVLLNETFGFGNYIVNISAIALTWSLGWFSYSTFERLPVNKIKSLSLDSLLLAYRKSIIIVLIVLIYSAGSFSGYGSQIGSYHVVKAIQTYKSNFDSYVPIVFQGLSRIEPLRKPDNCHYKASKRNDEEFFKLCLEDKDKTKPNFYLIGDSHAMMLKDGLDSALEKMKYNFYWIQNNGMSKIINEENKNIDEMNYISKQLGKDDILAFTFFRGKLNEDNNLSLSKNLSETQIKKSNNFKSFFIKNVRELSDKGIKVILINDGPRLKLNVRAQVCLIREKMSGVDVCMLSNENSKLDRMPMTKLFNNLALSSENIFVLDYHDQLCAENCSYKNDKGIIMIDYNHISRKASMNLENFWSSSIQKILRQ